jgi:hypothetical protein
MVAITTVLGKPEHGGIQWDGSQIKSAFHVDLVSYITWPVMLLRLCKQNGARPTNSFALSI